MIIEQDVKCWDSVDYLYQAKQVDEAASVLRLIVENTFNCLNVPTNLIPSLNTFSSVGDSLQKLRQLDLEVKRFLGNNEYSKAKEAFAEFANELLTLVPEEGKDDIVKQLVMYLVSERNKHKLTVTRKTKRKNLKGVWPIKAPDSDFYTTEDVAKIQNVSSQTVRRWCERGYYPGAFQTRGGHWRIPSKHFKTTPDKAEHSRKIMGEIDNKSAEAGEVDEFDL